jgi:hypothetical protein
VIYGRSVYKNETQTVKTKLSIFIFLIAHACAIYADDNSARRYASLQADPVICKYFLLSTKSVQEKLSISLLQIKSLESAMLASPTSIVAVVELRRSQKQLLEATQSDEERLKIRQAGNEKAHLLIRQNWVTVLQSTLSPIQGRGLDQLLLQMKGPHAILENTNLIQQLNLTTEQISQLNKISDSYSQILSLLGRRYLSLQINPIRKRSDDDVSAEMKSLVQIIKEVERDQDCELLLVLNAEQIRMWNSMCGSSVHIDWDAEHLTDIPFENEK